MCQLTPQKLEASDGINNCKKTIEEKDYSASFGNLSLVNSNEKSPAHENHIEKNTLNRDLAGIIQKYEKHEIQQNSKLSENA